MLYLKSYINKVGEVFRLSGKAFGAYKKQILLLVGIGFGGGILEGIGINALIPMFSFITGELSEKDVVTKFIEHVFGILHVPFALKYLLVFIVLLFIMKAVILFVGKYIQTVIVNDYEKLMRARLLRKTLDAKWPHLLNQKIGYLDTILVTEVRFVALLLREITGIILTITGLIIYMVVAINISAKVTIIVLGIGVVLLVGSKPLIDRARLAVQQSVPVRRNVAHFVNENILGAKTVKTLSGGSRMVVIGEENFEKLKRLAIRSFLFRSPVGSAIQPISMIFVAVIFALLYTSPGFNLAIFIALAYLIERIFVHIQQLNANIHKINSQIPYLKSVLQYEEGMEENREGGGGNKSFVFSKELSFRNVSFSYLKGQKVLDKLSFSERKGEMIGLIGNSGGGKTTVVDVVLRLLSPKDGAIFLDGVNAEDIALEEWRKNVGHVSQDIHLVNDTIANNIAFYNPDISMREIEQAARDAYIYDFIQTLPKKFDTIVGDRGVKLSVGQRQRIVIARVLVRHPQLLILDEATSALDNESELNVQKTVEGLHGKITVLVIAHRLSTVLSCDRLLVLEGGRIAEEGKPKELLENKDSYFF
jgi:ABC-type multidrug transport system fused ATPase/permease subunit